MLKKYTSTICKRLYHDSTFINKRTPVVKVANTRVGRAVRQRLDLESQPKVQSYDPSKKFEPYPFAVTETNKQDVIKRIISPLHDMSYEEQLASKESYSKNSLRYLAQQLYKTGTPIRLDVSRLPCHFNPIVRSPEIYNYRNKDEFSIWRGHDGETNTVGYMAFPISKHGDTVCIEPNGCEILKEETVRMADILQDFIRHQAKLPVAYSLGEDGGWRRFMVRVNLQGEIMLVGVASPRTLTVQQVIDERENFREFLIRRSKEAGLHLRSLYFQPCPHNHCKQKDVPYELLHGDETLKETINGFNLIISPESYIHPNSSAAQVYYKSIRKTVDDYFSFGNSAEKPIVIDIGCGIGVLSLHMADLASKVIGIDGNGQAIHDAITNSKLNGIENIEFICADTEIVIERVLEKYSKFRNEILVVCKPPKMGLRKSIVDALRQCERVKKLIYVTPKADRESVIDNLITLCRIEKGKSTPPFIPIAATPVDVCPHVNVCELIIALERLPE